MIAIHPDNPSVIFSSIHRESKGALLQISCATDSFGCVPGSPKRRQEHCGEDCDDRYNDQEFY